MVLNLPNNKKLIVFDGVCNLCNRSVQFVIKHDKKNRFIFAALQSDAGKQMMEAFDIDTLKMDSLLLYTPKKGMDYKSTAVLKIASRLGFPINVMVVFLVIPAFIRNWVYDYIAKNRYRWFGKKEMCWIPTPELKGKFLD